MTIVEFFGLPGCGKSTACQVLAHELREQGARVLEYSYYSSHSKGKKAVIKGLFSKHGITYLLRATVFLHRNMLLFSSDVVKRIVFNLALIAFYRSIPVSDADYILLDEGIAQGVISGIHTRDLATPRFEWVASLLADMKVRMVYIKTDPDIACLRIEKRNDTNHGRCDAIRGRDERLAMLKTLNNNFNSMSSQMMDTVNLLLLDGSCSPEENMGELRSFVKNNVLE